MIKMLPAQIAAQKKLAQNRGAPKVTSQSLLVKSSELSRSVGFDFTEDEGRYAVAKSDIVVGEKILAEEPHCVMLLEKYARSHCQHCFRRYF